MNNEIFHPDIKSNQPFGFVVTGIVGLIVSILLPYKTNSVNLFVSTTISGYQLGFITIMLFISITILSVSAYIYKTSDTILKIKYAMGIAIIGVSIVLISLLIFYFLNPVSPSDNLFLDYPSSSYSYGVSIAIFSQVSIGIGLIKMYTLIKRLSTENLAGSVNTNQTQERITLKTPNSPQKLQVSEVPPKNFLGTNANNRTMKVTENMPIRGIFCINCGSKTNETMKFCQTCGQSLD